MALVLVVGAGGTSHSAPAPQVVGSASSTAMAHDAPFTVASFPAAVPADGVAVQVPDPARVMLARLGIAAALQPLRVGPAGELDPPTYGSAGWYQNGPEPGEAGRAVIAGHVDSKSGPDVFANLRYARPGDRIVVDLVDGTAKTFVVDDTGLYRKSAFPTAAVYGPAPDAELRLITCGGSYDRAHGGYQSNVVVFAHEVS